MNHLAQDIRIALRGFRRTPTFAATAILVLGLGIGMTSAVFTVARAVLARPLPVHEQDRVVVPRIIDAGGTSIAIQAEQLEQLRHESRTMRDIAGVANWGALEQPLGTGDDFIALHMAAVTGNFFDLLGSRPAVGRLLRPEDDLDGGTHVLVLSYAAWQDRFGGDSLIIGRHLAYPYATWSYTIIGVAPPGLDYPAGAEVWVPTGSLGRPLVNIVARLVSNVPPSAAGTEFLAFMTRTNSRALVRLARPNVTTIRQAIVGDVRPALLVMTAAVGLLLLIACVNVGNLLLLHSSSRLREFGVRRALGASYVDLARQLLVESTMIAGAGGLLGLAVAEALLHVLLAFTPGQVPRLDMVRLAGSPVIVAMGVSMFTALVFGVGPALAGARVAPASLLRADIRAGTGTHERRGIRQALVASQIALALVMLAGAGLLVRSLQQLDHIKLGLTADRLSFVALEIPYARYDSTSKLLALGDAVIARLRAVPGVTAISPVLEPPFLTPNRYLEKVHVEGQDASTDDANPLLPVEEGGAEYFKALGIPLIQGRGFTDRDREDAPRVAVVSEAAARLLWPGQNPVGKRIHAADAKNPTWQTVVGVAGDIRFRRLRDATPILYLPWKQYLFDGVFAVRTAGPLPAVLPAMRHAVRDVDPGLMLWWARTMDDMLAVPLAQPRLNAILLSAFALTALVLAVVGLYGVMASAVREQTRDIGVRMALGATPERVRRDVMSRALQVMLAGAAIGIAGALISSHVLTALLFGVSANDPVVLGGVCVLLVCTGLLAAYIPARRATRVDPAEALRAE
jgi:predicted permease